MYLFFSTLFSGIIFIVVIEIVKNVYSIKKSLNLGWLGIVYAIIETQSVSSHFRYKVRTCPPAVFKKNYTFS